MKITTTFSQTYLAALGTIAIDMGFYSAWKEAGMVGDFSYPCTQMEMIALIVLYLVVPLVMSVISIGLHYKK